MQQTRRRIFTTLPRLGDGPRIGQEAAIVDFAAKLLRGLDYNEE